MISNDQILLTLSRTNDKDMIKDFLKKNPNANSMKNTFQQTLLHLAAMYDNRYLVKLLLKKKYMIFDDKNIQIDIRDRENYTPLLCSISEGNFDISMKLLAKGADPNARTSSGSSPLHLLSKHSYIPKSYKVAQLLIESGSYINHKDSKFDTPLHRATIYNDNNDFIRLLLEHGANPNIVNKRGRSCQHTAIEEGKIEALELFIQYGANFNKSPSSSPLPSPLEYGLQSNRPHIQNFFNERVGKNGENVVLVENKVSLGKYSPVLYASGDSIQVSNQLTFQPGKLIITNYRIVFKLDSSSNSTNNTAIAKNWLFSEEEEVIIPIGSISSISTTLIDQSTSQNSNSKDTQNTNQTLETNIYMDDSFEYLNMSSSANSIQMTTFSNPVNNNNNTVNNTKENQNLISNSNINHINIDTKDFKLDTKFFFQNSSIRDKIYEIIEYLYKLRIERSSKFISINQTLQKKVVEENIKLTVESRIEHIDRFESFGIFEEPVPILFSYFYRPIEPILPERDGWKIYNVKREYARFGIQEDSDTLSNNLYWRFTSINKDFKFCSSYPTTLIVSRVMLDKDLEKIFSFRSKGRIPVLSWKDPNGYASISRCSQPLVGIERTRCVEDETLCSNLACNSKPLYLLDARPKLNAIANTANGAGFENVSNYNNCKLVFMNIPNIHVMRKSLEKLVSACNSLLGNDMDSRFWSTIEESSWLNHIKSVLTSAVFAVNFITSGTSILVHCSDGWDRTPQMTSLAQILLDPYYRTIYGFQVLIEKEWLSFGHKFSQRLGHLRDSEEEVSPIFQQFLDCVFQLLNQFPVLFEFSPNLLLFLSEHQFSCKYGTFLHNCDKDRQSEHVKTRTLSIWTEINQNLEYFVNPYYSPPKENYVIRPNLHNRSIELWKACYLKQDSKSHISFNNFIININNQNNCNSCSSNTTPSNSNCNSPNLNTNVPKLTVPPTIYFSPKKSNIRNSTQSTNSNNIGGKPYWDDISDTASNSSNISSISSPTISNNNNNDRKNLNSLTLSYSSALATKAITSTLKISNNYFNQKIFDRSVAKIEPPMLISSHRNGEKSNDSNLLTNSI